LSLSPSLATPIELDSHIRPMLLVVVDTEEEFDWDKPFSRDARSTANMREQHRAQAILDRYGATRVTPPYSELVSPENSYGCNLDPALEREKIEVLTETVAAGLGTAPVHFRAGRYGLGFGTLRTLRALGYRTELSIAPHSNFASDGGPSFYGWTNEPYWHGTPGGLLGIPVTTRAALRVWGRWARLCWTIQ